MMDNVIKPMYVTINSAAGLSTQESALRVRVKGNEEEARGNKGVVWLQLAPLVLI